MSDTWAVTGASGFLGSALIADLARDGLPVRGLSRRGEIARAVTIHGDVRDAAALLELVRGADVVVHLAAYVHRATRSEAERNECRAINVDATRLLVEVMTPEQLLVFVSSANVYAASEEPLSETASLAPRSVYGESKLDAERLILDAVAAKRIRAVILRPGMLFGPGAPGNLGRMLSMIRRGVFPMFSGGRQRKTIVPVEVAVAAIRAVDAKADATNGQVFNVAAGPPLTIDEIGTVLAESLGVRARRISLPRAPAAFFARVADAMAKLVPLALPSFSQLIETYATNAILDDSKLRGRVELPNVDVRAALRRVSGAKPPLANHDARP